MKRLLVWLQDLFSPKLSRQYVHVDVAGVELRESEYDCPICGCPGYECINPAHCPRAPKL